MSRLLNKRESQEEVKESKSTVCSYLNIYLRPKVKNESFNIVDVYNIEITEIFSLQTFFKCIKTSHI